MSLFTRMYLCSRYWRFGRTDGTIIANKIKLNRDGTIVGHSHPNEARWELQKGILVFCREDGVATTRFGIKRLSPHPAELKGVFLFDENITHILTEVGRVPLPKREVLPTLLLVKPNLGQPAFLTSDQFKEGFILTVAGRDENVPSEWQLLLTLRNHSIQLLKHGQIICNLGVTGLPEPPKKYPRFNHPVPANAEEHKYLAGFRWECNFTVKPVTFLADPGEWPQLLDLQFSPKNTAGKINPHAIYISDIAQKSQINFLHVTDSHVAVRNDVIPEVLSESRDRHQTRRLRLRYNNFNDNLRTVIKFANKEQVDFIVLTGDMIDYYHDGILTKVDGNLFFQDYEAGERGERGGWLGKVNLPQSSSNLRKFVEIITGSDNRCEALRCPIICIPGNHEYLYMEYPIYLNMTGLGISFKQLRSPGAWGINDEEAKEFEFWKRKKGDSLSERLKRLREGKKFPDVGCEQLSCVVYGEPDFEVFETIFSHYLTEIAYDIDFSITIGKHRLILLNTGQDVGIPDISDSDVLRAIINWDLGAAFTRTERHFLDDQSNNRGILLSHYHLITQKVLEAKAEKGLAILFTHAPFVRERTPGFDPTRIHWNQGTKITGDENCFLDSHIRNKNWIPGLDGATAEWDSRIPVSMVRWLQEGAGDVDIIFSGHSHDVREYRMDRGVQACKGSFAADLSTTTMDKKEWLSRHHPLQFISGTLKGSKREFRQIVIQNNHARSFSMREIPGLNEEGISALVLFFTAKSIELARYAGYQIDARNDLNPATHFKWAESVNNRHAVMWDLMEKYWLQLCNIEYLENILESEGHGGMPPDLRKKLENVDDALKNASAKYARIAGRYPNIDWWYGSRDMDRRKSQFYAISAVSLSEFGIDFGSPGKSTLDLSVHYKWARDRKKHHWRTERLQDAIEERIGKLFEFAKTGHLNLLAMWFASESVHLAPWSDWINPARDNREPGFHLRWALSQNRDRILDDLCEKYKIAANYNFNQSHKAGLTKFYIYHSIRLAAWGASVGNLDEQPDKVYFEAQAARLRSIAGSESAWVTAIIKDMQDRVRRTGNPLTSVV